MDDTNANSFELQSTLTFNLPSRKDCTYTSCYCEENVWFICKSIVDRKECTNECYCVFVSNDEQRVIFWNHTACGPNHYVEWDYHVFAIYGSKKKGYLVLDLDSVLQFPISFNAYIEKTFELDSSFPRSFQTYKRYFRVIPAKIYLEKFSSDRRHMRIGDSWSRPPPNYLPICKDSQHNLDDFISMKKGKGNGTVLEYDSFVSMFTT